MKTSETKQLATALYAFMDRIGSNLNVANGYLDMVASGESGPLSQEQQKHLDKVEQAISDLIEFRERGMLMLGMWINRSKLNDQLPEPFSRVVSMIQSRFYRESMAKCISFNINCSAEAGYVLVLSNIISRLVESFIIDGIAVAQAGDRIDINASLVEFGLSIDMDFHGNVFATLKNLNNNRDDNNRSRRPFTLSFLCAGNIAMSLGGACYRTPIDDGIRFNLLIPEVNNEEEVRR